jgi:hypothetical protein
VDRTFQFDEVSRGGTIESPIIQKALLDSWTRALGPRLTNRAQCDELAAIDREPYAASPNRTASGSEN